MDMQIQSGLEEHVSNREPLYMPCYRSMASGHNLACMELEQLRCRNGWMECGDKICVMNLLTAAACWGMPVSVAAMHSCCNTMDISFSRQQMFMSRP